MSNLVLIKKQSNQEILVTTSEVIAERVKNSHDSVQKLIRTHIKSLESFGKVGFEIRASKKNQEEKIYFLNEQQSTLLVTFMRNNDEVIKFKIDLVKQFYQMRELLHQKQTEQWQNIREESKLQNSALTDQIQLFVDYAKSQGSSNFQYYYKSIQELANKAVGISNGQRNYTDMNTLSAQMFIFNALIKTMRSEMVRNTPYKQVYKQLKFKSEEMSQYIQPQQIRIGAD